MLWNSSPSYNYFKALVHCLKLNNMLVEMKMLQLDNSNTNIPATVSQLTCTKNDTNQLLTRFWGKKDVLRFKLYLVTYDTVLKNIYFVAIWYHIWTYMVNTIHLFRSDLQQSSQQIQQLVGVMGGTVSYPTGGLGTKKSKCQKIV